MSTASLLQSLTSAPIWTLLADLPLTAKQEKIRPAAARKGQPRGSFAIPTPFRASSNKLVHAAPQYLRYFLDGQHAGFSVTVFPAADILDPASDGLGKLSLGSCLQPDGQPFIYLPFLSFLFAVRLFAPCCVGCCSHILLTFLIICHTPHIFKNFFMVQPPPSASAAAYYTPEFWPQ